MWFPLWRVTSTERLFLDFSCPSCCSSVPFVCASLLLWFLLCLYSPPDSMIPQASDGALFFPMVWESTRSLWMDRELRSLPRAIIKMRTQSQQGLPPFILLYSSAWINEDLGKSGVSRCKDKERNARGLRYCFIFSVRVKILTHVTLCGMIFLRFKKKEIYLI